MGQTQNLARARDDRQRVVLEKTATPTIPDRTRPLQSRVGGEVQLGGVVQDEDQGVLAHGLLGVVPMGLLELGHGRLGSMAESIKSAEFVPIEDQREGVLGPLGDFGGRVDQTLVAATVAEVDGAEGF